MRLSTICRFIALLISVFLEICNGQLSNTKRIAIDSQRQLKPMLAKSLVARFESTNPVWIQLWLEHNVNLTLYKLVWQIKVTPDAAKVAKKQTDVINLGESQVLIHKDHRLGITNHMTPGPLGAIYRRSSKILFSSREKENLPQEDGHIKADSPIHFDNLEFPYHIPVEFCDQPDCPKPPTLIPLTIKPPPGTKEIPPTIKPPPGTKEISTIPTRTTVPTGTTVPARTDFGTTKTTTPKTGAAVGMRPSDKVLLSREMIIGLIVWNIILSAMLIVIILVLMCMCADREKERRKAKKQSSFCGIDGPMADPGDVAYNRNKLSASGTMRSWKSSLSDEEKLTQ